MFEFPPPTDEEISTIPRIAEVEEAEAHDPLLESLIKLFPKTVEGVLASETTETFSINNLHAVTKCPSYPVLSDYTSAVILDQTGKVLFDFMSLLPPDKVLRQSFRNSTINNREGVAWVGPKNLLDIFTLFHEFSQLEIEMTMTDGEYAQYNKPYLSENERKPRTPDQVKKTLEVELRAWAMALAKLNQSPLRELLFDQYSDQDLRRAAIACYKGYLD